MHRFQRVGLGFLTTVQLVVGVWALFFPAKFFGLEVVGMGMAYNEHLMRDYGAMTLATAVVLGAAAIRMSPWLTRTALVMYLVWAVPHFLVHVAMVGHLAPRTAAILLVLLGLAIVAPAGLLVLALRTGTGEAGRLEPRRG